MDLRSLQSFLVVAQEQNITRAAERLHIAQPSLSRQMIELENDLGKQLLVRGKRSLSLTEDGVQLRKRAEELVALAEKTRQEISSSTAEISGRIAIGGAPTERLLQAAAALRREHPGVQFEFYASDATDVVERLDHGSLDFAVLLEPVDTAKYEFLSLNDSARWGLLMPTDSPLAVAPSVQRETLFRVPLVFHRRAGLQMEIARWAQTEPELLPVAATYNIVSGNPAIFVRSGLGCVLTTEDHLADNADADVCFRPLEPPLLVHHALVWKRHPLFSRAAAAFLAQLSGKP